MTHVSKEELQSKVEAASTDSVRILDSESMKVGLKRYSEDTAKEKGPREHTEDELYYILDGSGKIEIGEEIHLAAVGDLLYVPQGEAHDIVEIDSEMTVLKIFRG